MILDTLFIVLLVIVIWGAIGVIYVVADYKLNWDWSYKHFPIWVFIGGPIIWCGMFLDWVWGIKNDMEEEENSEWPQE